VRWELELEKVYCTARAGEDSVGVRMASALGGRCMVFVTMMVAAAVGTMLPGLAVSSLLSVGAVVLTIQSANSPIVGHCLAHLPIKLRALQFLCPVWGVAPVVQETRGKVVPVAQGRGAVAAQLRVGICRTESLVRLALASCSVSLGLGATGLVV
jgi:hypothetical protein